MIVWADEVDGYWLRVENSEARVLKVQERIVGSSVRGNVTISDDRLDVLQLFDGLVRSIKIECRQQCVGSGSDSEIILQKEHAGDLGKMGGILRTQIGRIVG